MCLLNVLHHDASAEIPGVSWHIPNGHLQDWDICLGLYYCPPLFEIEPRSRKRGKEWHQRFQ